MGAAATMVVAVLAGCSPGGDGPDAPPVTDPGTPPATAPEAEPTPDQAPAIDLAAIDPCELVTQEEAEAIIGLEVAEPERTDRPDRRSCTYYAPPTGPVGKVDIYVGRGAENILGFNRDLLDHEFTAIGGVGDEAYQKPYEFYFRKGEVWIFIGVVRIVNAAELDEPIGEAARRAAARV